MMPVKEAAEHLRALMASMYEGKSVRNPEEFKHDLAALRTACEILEQVTREQQHARPNR